MKLFRYKYVIHDTHITYLLCVFFLCITYLCNYSFTFYMQAEVPAGKYRNRETERLQQMCVFHKSSKHLYINTYYIYIYI